MLIRRIFFALSLASALPALACLNDYAPNPQAIARATSLLGQLTQHEVKEDWAAREVRLRKELANGGDYRVKNDLATTLTHTNQAAEAVTLLEQIEAEKPSLYMTAANLGTAYELSGNDEKALEWIRKGIERNPGAHEGTEWLHVRILEAKLALSKEPKWLETHSVLGAIGAKRSYPDENLKPIEIWGRPQLTIVGNRNEPLKLDQVKSAMIYQLHERLQFVKPPDAVVASLLLDLGDLVGHESTGSGGAAEVYKLALKYSENLDSGEFLFIADARLRKATRGQRVYRSNLLPVFTVLAAAGVVLGALVIAVLRWVKHSRS